MIGIGWGAIPRAAALLGIAAWLAVAGAASGAEPEEPAAPAAAEATQAEAGASEPAPTRGRSAGIEEIVVTAEKRETRLQTTPVAISAFTEGDLQSGGYEDFEDLAFAIPNVQFGRSFSGTGGITIRGISSARGDRSTAFHVDGVYRNEARPADTFSFFDVQRVEVLRGPQGTLYGRNATGGSINVVSNPPSPEVEAGGDVQIGTYDQIRTRAFLNVPVHDDKVMTRFALLHEERDGFQRNGNGFRSQDMDDEGVIAGRAQVRIVPVPEVDLTLRTEHTHRDVAGLARKTAGDFPEEVAVSEFLPPLELFRGATPNPDDPRRIFLDLPGRTEQNDHSLNGTLTWDFYDVPGLGDVELTAIGSWFDLRTDILQDQDLSDASFVRPNGTRVGDIVFASSDIRRDVTEWVGELRLASIGPDPFQWIVGAFYLNSQADQFIDSRNLLATTSLPFEQTVEEDAESLAGFGRGSYTFFDELTVTLGARFTYDAKDASVQQDEVAGILEPLDDRGRDRWKVPTWEARLDWRWSDDSIAYLSASRGYKAGVINTQINPETDERFEDADEEIVYAFELGSKNRLFDNRLQLNFAWFYYLYEDIQFSQVVDTIVVTQNAAEAFVTGLEAEIVFVPAFDVPLPDYFDLANFLFTLNGSYLDTEYDDFDDCVDPQPPAPGEPPRDTDCSGQDLILAPEWTVVLSGQYRQDLGRLGSLTPRFQFFASAKYDLLPFGRAEDRQDSFHKTDLRLTWRDRDERFFVEGFVENLEDEDVKQTIVTGSAIVGGTRQLIYDRPRTAGVRIGAEW